MAKLSRLVLEIDDKGIVTANGNLDLFKKKSDEAAKAASGVEKANKDNAKSFDLVNQLTSIHTLATGAATLAVLKFAGAVVTAAGNMESIKTQLQVVSGSAKQADVIFRDLQEFAAKTPFAIDGITDTAIQLMQVGVQAKDLRNTLTMLGDVSGGSQEKLNRIMMNYTQILSVGKASTMDVRQFAQANLPIYQELANVTGKSGEALQDMITSGKITGEVVTEAFRRMTAEGGKFYNGMNLASQTYEGKLSTMKDSITNLAAKFGDLWLLDFQKRALDAITTVSDAIAEALDKQIQERDARAARREGTATVSQDLIALAAEIRDLEKRIFYAKQYNQYLPAGTEEKLAQLKQELNLKIQMSRVEYTMSQSLAEQARIQAIRDEAAKKAAEEAAEKTSKWQQVLKSALDLEEVTTGRQAVADYIENIETSLNGSLVFAQAFGGSVVDVYEGYSDKVRKAIHEILKSGFWQIDEDTVQALIKLEDRLDVSGKERTGFKTPRFGPGTTPEFVPSTKSPFSLAPFGSDTGFSLGISDEDRLLFDEERVSREEAQAKRLEEIYKNLGDQLKQFAADATFDALWDLGEALYEGGNAAEAFGRSLFLSILRNVPAMLFQAGFQLAISPGGLYAGLGLMAISGLGAVAGGYLTKAMDSDSNEQDEKARKLEALTQQLADLITQSKANAEYFASGLRSRNADYLNSVVSVNDAIITKDGKIVKTHPEDYLIATKTPGSLIGAGSSPKVNFTIINSISNEVGVEVKEKTTADGGKELVATLRKLVKSDIAKGEYDSVLASRTSAIHGSGRRVSQ